MSILNVDLDKINLDDVNFDKAYPETINHVRLGIINLKFTKHIKKL